MPWSEMLPMDQRMQFVADFLQERGSVAELCSTYGVSRRVGYKWIDRYLREGPSGLQERSRRPHHSPARTAVEVEAALLEGRKRHPTWGARKIIKITSKRHPRWDMPHPSTVCDIFKRHGLVKRKPLRRKVGHPGKPTLASVAPNDVWCADFKGQFKTGDGIYCYPLTITDNYSRFLIECQSLLTTACADAKPIFTRAFKEYGLPRYIRTDNGVPFATTTLARLSMLSAWWVRLGVLPQLIEPGKPQQNGRHERMHRTLKHETARPPAGSLRAQQRRFNVWREEFNQQRPHEALGQDTPAAHYVPSSRQMPDKLLPFEYPDRFEVRYVSGNGGIRWNHRWVNVSTVCIGEYVGLEEIDDGVWNVYFGPLKLGRLNERHMRIEDANGRLKRR